MTYNVAIVGIDDPQTFQSNLGMMTGNEYMVPFNETSIHIHPDWNENLVSFFPGATFFKTKIRKKK